jgi:hypothetical protein
MPISDFPHLEYQALRATIRERGTMRIRAVLAGFVAWGGLVSALVFVELHLKAYPSYAGGAFTLVPLAVLAATFEVNFFVHTGVERIGRYIQVFYEEADASNGWETTAMSYGTKFPSPPLTLDPLFVVIFAFAAAINFLSSLGMAPRPEWIAVSLVAHLAFAYRIVLARKAAAAQRSLDLERFRSMISK